ncbi:molybdopterin molybdotransferase MoeA [Helicobacter sp. 11S03491-1]|uniref:molybdopterin molybdotransferase MoeA n=1 Tax=Helicobacter sp. 11S03491-1 TaxID=1476196 RepID=UPI000BA7330F|nr:molybdopterin molybdotransferase MoeA [Helicobacter sp. 11S03491-1]PAF42317.1 hypothetical protein BKH45_05085 [Helicobacter sp. 11S03491-1]
MQKNISFYEAIDLLRQTKIDLLSKEKVIFSDGLNRILAQDVVAKDNMPKFCTSSMDGYAFCYEDLGILQTQGLVLQGDNPAGAEDKKSLESKATIKTFTGSKMPQNSDTILIVENALIKEGRVFLSPNASLPKKGQWVRQVGENYSKGDVLLRKNSRIGAYEIGLLADLNQVFIEVYKKPRVAILSGGSEIIEVGEERISDNTIYSVNNHLLKAMVISMGGEAVLYPVMPDNKEDIKTMMSEALRDCDILLSTGGMSMGDYDFTQQAIEELCEIVFKGVRIKPGKPVIYGIFQNQNQKKYLFGLPGFPNSAAITFYLFGKIIFAKMLGMDYKHQFVKAILSEKISKNDERMEFRVCDLNISNGKYQVDFSTKRVLQSSVVNNLCGESALVVLPEGEGEVAKGAEVDIIFFKNFL